MKNLILITPLIVIIGLLLFVFGHEYWLMSIEKDVDTIASYYFGSESMIAHGGNKYSSLESYSSNNLVLALVSLFGMFCVVIFSQLKIGIPVLNSYLIGLVILVIIYMINWL